MTDILKPITIILAVILLLLVAHITDSFVLITLILISIAAAVVMIKAIQKIVEKENDKNN